MAGEERIRTFREFYPYYLAEHSKPATRRLHFAGTTLVAAILVAAVVFQVWWLVLVAVVQAYAFAWVGHFAFERNKPATFRYPLFSFAADWVMWWDVIRGRVKL